MYYVGTAGISSFLITTPEGHILLDTGYEENVAIIRDSVRELGFEVRPVYEPELADNTSNSMETVR